MLDLTPAEREVMDYLVAGMRQVEIAKKRGVVKTTINTHVEHVRDKLGARTTVEAAVLYSKL